MVPPFSLDSPKRKPPPCVYLLDSSCSGRTYVGSTVGEAVRRLRQHNGELVGGAAQTVAGRPWTLALRVTGFRTRREALQFEFAWRRVHRHMRPRPRYDLEGRRASLEALMARERWSRNAPLASEVPLHVQNG